MFGRNPNFDLSLVSEVNNEVVGNEVGDYDEVVGNEGGDNNEVVGNEGGVNNEVVGNEGGVNNEVVGNEGGDNNDAIDNTNIDDNIEDCNNDKLAYGSNFPCHNDEAGDSDIDFSKNAKINQPYSFRDRKERVYSSTYECGDFYFSLSEDNNGNISELDEWVDSIENTRKKARSHSKKLAKIW